MHLHPHRPQSHTGCPGVQHLWLTCPAAYKETVLVPSGALPVQSRDSHALTAQMGRGSGFMSSHTRLGGKQHRQMA